MQMVAFPELPHGETWHDRLSTIARSEVDRIVYGFGVRLDRDDAIAFAVSEAWIAVTGLRTVPASLWGFVRVVMRRRIVGQFVQRSMRKKRGGAGTDTDRTRPGDPVVFVAVPASAGEGRTSYAWPVALTCNPWHDVEDQIAAEQIADRYDEHRKRWHSKEHQARETRSRQREHQARGAFLHYARHVQNRRYD